MVWHDAYNLNGGVYFAVVYEKASSVRTSHHRKLYSQNVHSFIESSRSAGYSVLQIDSYESADRFYYSVLLEQVPRYYQVVYHSLTPEEHDNRVAELTAHGYRPVNVSAAYLPGLQISGPRYTGLWDIEDVGNWALKRGLTSSAYYAQLGQQAANGLQLAYLHGHSENGSPRFTAIFNSRKTTHWKAHSNENENGYTGLVDHYAGEGYKLRFVTGYQNGSTASYGACWTRNDLVAVPAPGRTPIGRAP